MVSFLFSVQYFEEYGLGGGEDVFQIDDNMEICMFDRIFFVKGEVVFFLVNYRLDSLEVNIILEQDECMVYFRVGGE